MTSFNSSSHSLGTSDLVGSQDQTLVDTRSVTPNTFTASSVSECTPLIGSNNSNGEQGHRFSDIRQESRVRFHFNQSVLFVIHIITQLALARLRNSDIWVSTFVRDIYDRFNTF